MSSLWASTSYLHRSPVPVCEMPAEAPAAFWVPTIQVTPAWSALHIALFEDKSSPSPSSMFDSSVSASFWFQLRGTFLHASRSGHPSDAEGMYQAHASHAWFAIHGLCPLPLISLCSMRPATHSFSDALKHRHEKVSALSGWLCRCGVQGGVGWGSSWGGVHPSGSGSDSSSCGSHSVGFVQSSWRQACCGSPRKGSWVCVGAERGKVCWLQSGWVFLVLW